MPRFELDSTVKAPRSFVFAELCKSENLPETVSIYRSLRPKGKEGEWELSEFEAEGFGTKITGILKMKFYPDSKIEEVVESSMATGTNTRTFEDSPEGTNIHYSFDIKLKSARSTGFEPVLPATDTDSVPVSGDSPGFRWLTRTPLRRTPSFASQSESSPPSS